MVNPKNEPGFENPRKEHGNQDRVNRHSLKDRWSNRMRSTLIRMSQGASNFWTSMARPHGIQCRATSKRSKK